MHLLLRILIGEVLSRWPLIWSSNRAKPASRRVLLSVVSCLTPLSLLPLFAIALSRVHASDSCWREVGNCCFLPLLSLRLFSPIWHFRAHVWSGIASTTYTSLLLSFSSQPPPLLYPLLCCRHRLLVVPAPWCLRIISNCRGLRQHELSIAFPWTSQSQTVSRWPP